MHEKVTTMEIRARLGDILNRVSLRNDEFVVERKGKPLAAIVPVGRLDQMRRAARAHLAERLQAPAAVPAREADRLADEAKHRTRKARRRSA